MYVACGATLVVELAPNAGPQQVRRYTVPAEYCSRNDAKLAVVHHAVQEGVIDFLRCHGNPPPGYVPFVAQQEQHFAGRKRKNWEPGIHGSGGYGNSSTEWATRNRVDTAPPGGSWQNKRQRTGGNLRGGFGYASQHGGATAHGHNQGSGHSHGYLQTAPGGGYQQTGAPVWGNSFVSRPARKQSWKDHPSAGVLRGQAGNESYTPSHYKPGPGVSSPSRFTQTGQGVAIPSPSVTYPYVAMPPNPSTPSASPYPYQSDGAVPQGPQIASSASYGTVPPQIPIPYQSPTPHPPVPPGGVPNAMSPNIALYPPQAIAAIPPAPTPVQYPQLQYPVAFGYPTAPGGVQVQGHPYPAIMAQPQHVPTAPVVPQPPPAPVVTPTVTPTYPYLGTILPGATNQTHLPPLQSSISPPVQPVIPPPPPTIPPPLPPSQLPPPTVKPDMPSNLAPPSSAPKPTQTADPLSSWSTKPKNPAKVVSIQCAPKTNVSALYGTSSLLGLSYHHLDCPSLSIVTSRALQELVTLTLARVLDRLLCRLLQ